MLTVPTSLRSVTLLALLCMLGRGASRAADCNQNGVDDARDVFPSNVGFDRLATSDLEVPTREVLAGDCNGDGRVDLVLLGMENQAYLVENLGNRLLGAATRLDFKEAIGSIALTDLDGDFDLDLLTTELYCNACPVGVYGRIFRHLNNGKGQFSAGAPYEVDHTIRGMRVADVVGSPDPDVIFGSGHERKLFIYENGAGADLRPSAEVDATRDPIIEVVDLDLDGQADIVAAGECKNVHDTFGYVSLVYKSDGLGNFLLQNYYLSPFCNRNFAFLDLSADGFPDFAIVAAPGSLQIQVNDGTGRFMEPIDPLPMPGSNFGVSVGDFDRDGSTDLVVAHGEAITIVHDNRKMRKIELGKTYLVPWLEKGAVAVADLDNDGWLDLTASRGEAGIRILHGKEGGEFAGTSPGSLAYTENPNYIIQDFNSDGRKDLLLWSYESSAFVYLNQGDGTISDRIPVETLNFPNTAEVGDFDSDGHVDVVLRNHFCTSCAKETESVVAFYYGDGTGNFTLGFEAPAEARGGLMKVGDMDADGRLDLLSSFLGANFEFFWNDGGRSFTLFPAEEPIQFLDGYPFDMFDMNSDGLPDLAYYQPEWGLAVRLNEGSRKFGPPILEHSFFEDRDKVHYLPFQYPGFTMDLNDDSLPDLVRYSLRKMTVGLSDGDGTFSRSTMDLGAGDYSVEVVGMDFDGDGDIDLVVARDCYPTCNPRVAASEITVFENNGRGDFTRLKAVPWNVKIWHMHAEDYDGDGRQDLLVADGKYLNQLLLNRGNGTLELVPPSEAPQRLRFLVESDSNYGEIITFAQPAIDLDEDGDLDLVLIGGDVVSTLINHTTPAASRDANRDQIPDECQGRFFHRGDANTDTRLDIADAVFIAHHLFRGGAASTCAETEDTDNNGKVNISDAILILSHLFKGGLPPAAPGPVGEACGLDPDPDGTAGALGCTFYPGC